MGIDTAIVDVGTHEWAPQSLIVPPTLALTSNHVLFVDFDQLKRGWRDEAANGHQLLVRMRSLVKHFSQNDQIHTLVVLMDKSQFVPISKLETQLKRKAEAEKRGIYPYPKGSTLSLEGITEPLSQDWITEPLKDDKEEEQKEPKRIKIEQESPQPIDLSRLAASGHMRGEIARFFDEELFQKEHPFFEQTDLIFEDSKASELGPLYYPSVRTGGSPARKTAWANKIGEAERLMVYYAKLLPPTHPIIFHQTDGDIIPSAMNGLLQLEEAKDEFRDLRRWYWYKKNYHSKSTKPDTYIDLSRYYRDVKADTRRYFKGRKGVENVHFIIGLCVLAGNDYTDKSLVFGGQGWKKIAAGMNSCWKTFGQLMMAKERPLEATVTALRLISGAASGQPVIMAAINQADIVNEYRRIGQEGKATKAEKADPGKAAKQIFPCIDYYLGRLD